MMHFSHMNRICKTQIILVIVQILLTITIVGDFQSAGYAETSEDWDNTLLDTARDVDYLSAIEKDVVLELNKVRSNPQKYAEMYIKPRLVYFDGSYNGRGYSEPGKITLITNEGKKSVEECYNVLKGTKNMPALEPSKGMSSAAKSHVLEQGKRGTVGHNRVDGSSFSAVMNRYGRWGGSCAENISYGKGDARKIVIQLLVDDGVPSRGHRKSFIDSYFGVVGVAAGAHTKYSHMCVINLAQSYTEK